MMRGMAARARNILLITSDQQHWNTLGCLNGEIRTPNLDRLAAQGTLFTRAYCPNPTCTPTRASIITGKYPSQHGAWSLGTKLARNRAHRRRRPAGRRRAHRAGRQGALSAAGRHRRVPFAGSLPKLQDLDFWRRFHGPFYGFEHVELARNHTDEAHVGQHYALWMEDNGLANWRDYFRPPTGTNDRQQRSWEIPEQYHYGSWIAERSCDLLDGYAGRGERFFLWASFFDPHPKYLVPRAVGPDVRSCRGHRAGDGAGRARRQPAPLPAHPDPGSRLLTLAREWPGAARANVAPARPRGTGQGTSPATTG